MGCRFWLNNLFLNRVKINQYQTRFYYYVVHQNVKHETFYIKVDDKSKAVLLYKQDGKILDMQTISVPSKFQGKGLGLLLAESAFTYAIIHDFYMYLTCDYLQKYYRAIKTFDLEERVVGPPQILEGPDATALNPNSIYELPEPEDFNI